MDELWLNLRPYGMPAYAAAFVIFGVPVLSVAGFAVIVDDAK